MVLDEVLEVDAFVDLAAPVVALDQRMGQAALGIDAFGEAVEAVAELADRRMQQFVDLPGVTVQLRGFVGERPLRRAQAGEAASACGLAFATASPRGRAGGRDEHGQAGEPTERQGPARRRGRRHAARRTTPRVGKQAQLQQQGRDGNETPRDSRMLHPCAGSEQGFQAVPGTVGKTPSKLVGGVF